VGLAFKVLDEHVETSSGHISIGTMHLAKGLEFRAVAVMACDDEIIPLQERVGTVGDDADLRRSTIPSVICSTSPAPVLAITCSLRASLPYRNFWTTSQRARGGSCIDNGAIANAAFGDLPLRAFAEGV
jgi:hypothetical protein